MIDQELTIGKYTLESLTNGMYASPLDLYREYIQNSVDAIDLARRMDGTGQKEYSIDISVDATARTITVEDNGIGLSKSVAISTLIDIGNSKKNRNSCRGFRGIGRLAGLGYCEQLVFTTSHYGESVATMVVFDAKRLDELLLGDSNEGESINDVLSQIITVKQLPEKTVKRFFKVELIGVKDSDKLLDLDTVNNYLVQNAPIAFAHGFSWRRVITEKTKALGYTIPSYNIRLNGEELYKAYNDSFVSDRVKKNKDVIKDIDIIPFYRDDKLSAVLWCAKTNFFGTIIDNQIKGIRIRQGNILIGDKMSCAAFFKEERFNGWMVGEIHIVDEELIVNARRDDFEKNTAYYELTESIRRWALEQTHEIRKLSYERSLSAEKKAVVEAEDYSDVNELMNETLEVDDFYTESSMMDRAESDSVAETDFIGKLTALINQKKAQTKYAALNINEKLTVDQKRVLERVFDLIVCECDRTQADRIISIISEKF